MPVLVDGAQGVPHLPVDVQALDCDFYAFSGHKMYGPSGIGVLYGKAAPLLEAMPPWQGGGDMILSVTFEKTTYNAIPYKFEAGTPNIAGTIALGAAVDYLSGHRAWSASRAHEHELLELRARALLAEVPGAAPRRHGPREGRRAVSFVLEGVHPHDIGTVLDYEGVADPHRPPLRAAGDGALRRARHRARLARALQHARGAGRAGARACTRSGRCSDDAKRALAELRELYQEVILDHSKKPRNFRDLPEADRHAEGYNPLCGDRATVFVELDGERVKDVRFVGQGLLDLDRVGVDDDREREGQDARPRRRRCSSASTRWSRRRPEPGRRRRAGRAGQAGRLRGRLRVPGARQVRVAGLAHAEGGAGGRGRAGVDGVKR